ncbi:MAG: PLP-dependent aminotransferase family protein [Burkholderiales bacterium]|nr:PLP-dependent aminotransferase family protein [Burkholderiales bacterium]MCE7878089.1 PLP-dependent aminotransferase family protein [Betaproteobacteria bacterium PRO3]
MTVRHDPPMWRALLPLAFEGRVSLQAQIREMLTGAILDGRLPSGVALPSTRELSQQLGVARNTVAIAYELLVDEGYLVTRNRSGHFVNPEIVSARAPAAFPASAADAASQVHWGGRFRTTPARQRNIVKPRNWQRYPYPFLYGQIDPSMLPIPGWRECSTQALSGTEARGWAGDLIDGDDALLIEQIQTRLLARRGVFASADEILVTVGAQHALFLLATLLVGPATTVGVEDPGYPDARNILAARTPSVVALPLDAAGLALSPGLDACEYVVLTPSHQCPTNVTMPLARREALLAWAIARDRVLIEDDYETEIGLEGRALPALKSLDRGGRVVYVGSLSKTLAPGIRVGYIVAHRDLVREARALRRLMLRHPAANNERSAGLFLAMGYHDAHLRRLRQACAERGAAIGAALPRHLPDVTVSTASGASSCWLRFPDDVDTRALAMAAERVGVLIEPGDVFFAGDRPPHQYARLGFASIATDRIAPGIASLAGVLAELRGSTARVR